MNALLWIIAGAAGLIIGYYWLPVLGLILRALGVGE